MKFNVSYELKKVDGPDDWKEVSFYVPVVECSGCNDSFVPSEYAKIAHEASCVAAGVLTPDQIKSIRKGIDWGKNNINFSKILGFGSSTIARYESGASIPSKAHNKILTLLKYPEVLKDFENGDEYKKIYKVKLNTLNESLKKDNIIDLNIFKLLKSTSTEVQNKILSNSNFSMDSSLVSLSMIEKCYHFSEKISGIIKLHGT